MSELFEAEAGKPNKALELAGADFMPDEAMKLPKGEQNGGPDVGTADPTDGRQKNDWESKYPKAAKSQILCECWYIFALLIVSLALIFITWRNIIGNYLDLSGTSLEQFRQFSYYSFSGLLGGTVYGMKYLYRVVARGFWHEDRKPWRYMSPFIALAISFVFGAMIDGKFVTMTTPIKSSVIVGVGFLVGYFADRAIGKLHDIADVIFGHAAQKQKL